jgi:NADPH:quinone reductase
MRAITLATYGSPLVLSTLPEPIAAEGQEVVEVVYAAVNPLDVWVCQGNFAGVTPQPHTPGVEGLVRRADGSLAAVSGVGVGGPGTYAERVAAPIAAMVPVPKDVDPQQAASMGVAGVTAWMCLHSLAQVQASDTVLVLGASGGVGSIAAQLARLAGATVIGQTTSQDKVANITALECDAVVATDGAALAGALGGRLPSVVIDGLGGSFTGACVDLVGPAGRIVNFGTSAGTAVAFDMRTFYRKGTRLLGYGGLLLTPAQRNEAFAALFAHIKAGQLHVPIDAVLPLDQAGEAHRRILAKEVVGKLLLDPAKSHSNE